MKMAYPQINAEQTESLIRFPNQQTDMGASAVGGSSSRAYKVAGLTLLACVLIAGQAVTAYYVFSQRSDLRSLEDQSNGLKADLQRGRSAAMPMRIHMPMNIMPELMDDSTVEGASSQTPGERPATMCQLEAAGLKPVKLPVRPVCDEQGRYRAQQCWFSQCWCVDPASGQEIPGSMRTGPAPCGPAGRRNRVMAQPALMHLSEN